MIKKMDSDLDTRWKENYGCKEDRKLWDNFQSFYKEVIANKHLWKRDMLAITYVDVAKKYGYVGLKVLHPYEDFLITYFPGGYDYWTIAQVLCYPDNHGFETDEEAQDFLNEMPTDDEQLCLFGFTDWDTDENKSFKAVFKDGIKQIQREEQA